MWLWIMDNMNGYKIICQLLKESEIDSLKSEPEHIHSYIKSLQDRTKIYADPTGLETIKTLEKIRTNHPIEWNEMMDDDIYKKQRWIDF